jgi:hypothetical protein
MTIYTYIGYAACYGWQVPHSGGNFNNGSNSRPFYFNFNNSSGNRNANIRVQSYLLNLIQTYKRSLLGKHITFKTVLVALSKVRKGWQK